MLKIKRRFSVNLFQLFLKEIFLRNRIPILLGLGPDKNANLSGISVTERCFQIMFFFKLIVKKTFKILKPSVFFLFLNSFE